MANQRRPLLRLKGHEIVPADEDRIVDVGVFDTLLPCRKFDISYKVAVLGNVSPSLEFLLRLVKAVPGITAEESAGYFGYSQKEMAYVLEEGIGPSYIEQKEQRLWLTTAGDQLFKDGGDEPLIYSVESRRRSHGFDLLSVAPQRPQHLDLVELALPELPLEDPVSTGKVSGRLRDQFRRFFHELSDRADREQVQRRELYSIDDIAPGERFQTPVRITARAQASSPHLIEEIDLTSWRPDHELVDRTEIERAAALFVENAKYPVDHLQAETAYQALIELAPEFLKEFSVRDGLSVRRYWREAIGRTGEPRRDRKTIAMVGSIALQENITRLSSILDYGQRNQTRMPSYALSVAPQLPHWGATTLYRDLLSLVRRKIGSDAQDGSATKAICLSTGSPAKHTERIFDRVLSTGDREFPAPLELFLIPETLVAAVVHSPVGASSGYPVPLGFASFDEAVIARASTFVLDRLGRYQMPEDLYQQLVEAFSVTRAMAE